MKEQILISTVLILVLQQVTESAETVVVAEQACFTPGQVTTFTVPAGTLTGISISSLNNIVGKPGIKCTPSAPATAFGCPLAGVIRTYITQDPNNPQTSVFYPVNGQTSSTYNLVLSTPIKYGYSQGPYATQLDLIGPTVQIQNQEFGIIYSQDGGNQATGETCAKITFEYSVLDPVPDEVNNVCFGPQQPSPNFNFQSSGFLESITLEKDSESAGITCYHGASPSPFGCTGGPLNGLFRTFVYLNGQIFLPTGGTNGVTYINTQYPPARYQLQDTPQTTETLVLSGPVTYVDPTMQFSIQYTASGPAATGQTCVRVIAEFGSGSEAHNIEEKSVESVTNNKVGFDYSVQLFSLAVGSVLTMFVTCFVAGLVYCLFCRRKGKRKYRYVDSSESESESEA